MLPNLWHHQLTSALTITIQLVNTMIVQCNAYVYESVLRLVPACIISSVYYNAVHITVFGCAICVHMLLVY